MIDLYWIITIRNLIEEHGLPLLLRLDFAILLNDQLLFQIKTSNFFVCEVILYISLLEMLLKPIKLSVE